MSMRFLSIRVWHDLTFRSSIRTAHGARKPEPQQWEAKHPELAGDTRPIQQDLPADSSYAAPSMPCGSRTNFFGTPESNSA